ncbi:acyltransferase [Neorhizobium sp. P12A]|uniref:acyltransferase family protein n=1 Tax=Neorhizobium sp. P12A TaxID=2268027 RepID=UPI0011EF040F|nr:acyltransferase [Neorhizobium sp. P12A]KAA0694401.1 acyltransferase [Neorhizobium sp. P12A]
MNKTFGSVLTSYRGFGPGFDFLRIALAFSIVFSHAFLNNGSDEFFRGSPLWFLEYALVPMFFALSGFLICGSAQRLSLKNFLINRGLRIVPALAVDIVICALIIGPIFTTVSLQAYFSDRHFHSYFLNIFGYIHYTLPGVFGNLPSDQVNGALWTVPWEIGCYIIMSVFMLTAVVRSWKRLAVVIVTYVVVGMVVQFTASIPPKAVEGILYLLFVSRGTQLILAFSLGLLAYQLRDRIPYNRMILVACILIALAAVFLLDRDQAIYQVPNRIIVIPALVYITIFIGLTPMKLPAVFKKGDYSYGVYLYHDPFLQILMTLFPTLFLGTRMGAIALFIVGLCIAMAVATFSWHFIEKPILQMRKKYSFVATARGAA